MLINRAMLDLLSFTAVSFGRRPFSSWFALPFLDTYYNFLVAFFFLKGSALFLLSSQPASEMIQRSLTTLSPNLSLTLLS